MKYDQFLRIADLINQRLQVKPLLFGSLGLEVRLGISLGADDIDILIPGKLLRDDWNKVMNLMGEGGYTLSSTDKNEFDKNGIHVSFAAIEELGPFAGVDIKAVPVVTDTGVSYLLLELSDYLKVYKALSKDVHRRDEKKKRDREKIALINQAIGEDHNGN